MSGSLEARLAALVEVHQARLPFVLVDPAGRNPGGRWREERFARYAAIKQVFRIEMPDPGAQEPFWGRLAEAGWKVVRE